MHSANLRILSAIWVGIASDGAGNFAANGNHRKIHWTRSNFGHTPAEEFLYASPWHQCQKTLPLSGDRSLIRLEEFLRPAKNGGDESCEPTLSLVAASEAHVRTDREWKGFNHHSFPGLSHRQKLHLLESCEYSVQFINMPEIERQTNIPNSSHLERHGYLFGYPIAHSMSPLLHQTVYDGLGLKWSQLPLESTDMSLFLKLIQDPKFYGASVTMPHKVAILQHLDGLTPEGRTVGAVNTLFIRHDPETGKRLYMGTNTDVVGVRDSFYFNVTDPNACFHGRPALVIGGGGAARSAVYALRKWMKATKIYLVNRDRREVEAVINECTSKGYGEGLIDVSTVEQAEQLEGVGAIVSCVPNFPPVSPEEVEARRVLECFFQKSHKGAILEMCYHPSPWTEIAALAEKAQWQVILGTEAMIYQGLEQDRYWTGKAVNELPVQRVHEVISAKLSRL